tara:strand:- start:33 stop:1028 length:996 start_codon:yes stop_codon:yes gene_type:complete
MLSSSISIFRDSLRIPNPFTWIYNILQIYYNSKSVRNILKRQKNAVILSKGLNSHFVSIIANWKLSNKLIWHLQDLISQRFGGILLKLMNFLADIGPDFIVCDGKSIYNSLNMHSQSKADIILNGVEADLFQRTHRLRELGREELNIPLHTYVIGHVGRFTPWKGQLKLVEAFIDYSKQNNQAILLLVGAPVFDSYTYINDIKNQISKYGLDDKIILTGFRSDLDRMFSIMDLFVYPSLEKDTSPLVLLSALSSGLPVAASSIESLQEIIEKVPAIPLFNPLNKSHLINIYQKYEANHLRAKTSKTIRLEYQNHFNMNIHTQKMMEVLDSI